MYRRLLPLVGLTALFSLALTSGAVAGPGPQPGETHREDISAFTKIGPGPSFAVVDVRQGVMTFEPEDGPEIQQRGTILNLTTFGDSRGSGCFQIPDANFTASLRGAELHAVVGPASNCPPGRLVSASNAGSVGADDVLAPPPPPPGFTAPVKIDLIWTARGAVRTSKRSDSFACLDFFSETRFSNRGISASVRGTISALGAGSLAGSGQISENASDSEVSGTFDFRSC